MDLAAFSVIKSLGSALGLPYHRLSPVFRRDARYVEGVRRAYLTQSRDKQLLDLKQLLWTSGNKQIQIDEAAVTPTDVDIINGAVRGLKADPTTGDGFATLYMNMWENLDFRGGAKRVAERRVVVSEFQQRAAQIQELAMAREAQYLAASSYGLPAGTPVMVLDTRTLDATRRGLFMDRLTLISGYRGAVRGPVPGIDALVLEGQSARELLQFVRKDEILTSGFAVHLADSQRRLVVH